MTPVDLRVLITALLVAAAVGTAIAVAALSHRSLRRPDRRVLFGAALMAIPALWLTGAISQPDLVIPAGDDQSGERPEPTVVDEAVPAPRPVRVSEPDRSREGPGSSRSAPKAQSPDDPPSVEPQVSDTDPPGQPPGQPDPPPEPPGGGGGTPPPPPPPDETVSPSPSPPPTVSPSPDPGGNEDEDDEDEDDEND
jgi:hypothetical protein